MTPLLDDDQAALIASARTAGMPDVRVDLGAVRARVDAGSDPNGVWLPLVHDHHLDGPHGRLVIRQYSATAEAGQAALVYFHGGGMVVGSIENSDALCRKLCAESGLTVLSVDYRLAPEYQYPVATDEAYFATCWAAANGALLGIDPSRVCVGGDSSGGSLAAGVTLQARDADGPEISFQVLVYPGLERAQDRPSMIAFGEGPGITRAGIEWMKDQYLGPDPDRDTVYGVPATADDLTGLPEALIVLAQVDPLRSGGEDYADRLLEAGVQTTVMRYPGVTHGFLPHVGKLRRASQCASDIAVLLKARTSEARAAEAV